MQDRTTIYRQWMIFLGVWLITRTILSSALPLTDFSEARYAEIAREILVSGDWITLWFREDLPFWGKPPLAFWSVAASFQLLGVSEFSARLPSLIYTLMTASVLATWVRRHWSQEMGFYVAVVFLATFLVVQTAGAVITDPLLVLTTTTVMVAFWDALHGGHKWSAYLMWLALAAGLMAKGPLALVLCGFACGTWVLLYSEWTAFFRHARLFSGLALMLVVAGPWYYVAEQKTPGFFDYFIIGEHFERYLESEWSGDKYGGVKDQPLGMIWAYFLAGAMPWSLIALGRLFTRASRTAVMASYRGAPRITGYLLCWTLLPLVFFTPAKNILITYAMPALPAFAVLIATRFEWLIMPRRFLIPISTGAVIVFFVGFSLAWFKGGYEDHHYNQKPIIDAYQALATKDPGPLIYTGAYRFSPVFYTQDQVQFSARPNAYFIDDTFYYAVRDMWYSGPDNILGGRCHEVLHHSEFTLLQCPKVAPAH